MGEVSCPGCQAPMVRYVLDGHLGRSVEVDLAKTSACPHCGSPLSMLDMTHAGALVASLIEADHRTRPLDPTLPMQLERARREVEAAFSSFEHGPRWFDDVSAFGLVGAGLTSLTRWLKLRG